MVVIECPVEGCEWSTANRVAATLGAVLTAELNAHTAGAHTVAAAAVAPGPARPGNSSIKRPDRPIMKEDASDQDWATFSFKWGRYKRATSITENDTVRSELLYCCDTGLRARLLEMTSQTELETITEENLLELIKSVAVLSVDPVVHRVKFQSVKQDNGESFQKFVAVLKAKASLCDFTVEKEYNCSQECSGNLHTATTWWRVR